MARIRRKRRVRRARGEGELEAREPERGPAFGLLARPARPVAAASVRPGKALDLTARLQRARVLGHRPEVYLGLGPAGQRSPLGKVPVPTSGGLVQAAFAAKAKVDNHKIKAVRISGRPKGRFKGGAQGSHVTAYAVFRDVLESATLGRTVTQAYANVKTLIGDLKKLPGYAYFKNKKLPKKQPEAIDPHDVDAWELQELMSYYLEARDAAGYSAAFLGEGKAKGKGEGSILRRLRELENEGGLLTSEIPEAKKLVAGLYDPDAVDQLVAEAPNQKIRKLRRAGAKQQHLMTIYQAFPQVYNDLHAADATTYPSFSGQISQKEAKVGFDRATQRDLFQNLGVTAVPDGLGGYELTVSGRPAGPFDQSSKMGSHTIAYSLVVEALKKQMKGAWNAKEVKRRLSKLLAMQEDSPMAKKRFREKLSGNAEKRLKEADTYLESSRKTLTTTKSKNLDSSDVETAVEAILLHHNVSPLSSVDLGLANNNAEQKSLANLRKYERGEYPRKTMTVKANTASAAYSLLDKETISRIGTNKKSSSDLPGSRGNPAKEIAAILDIFFRYVKAAFPTVYAETRPHHEVNIAYFLRHWVGLGLDAEDVIDEMGTPVLSGTLNRSASLAGKRSEKKRSRSKDDDEDYVPSGNKPKRQRILKTRRRSTRRRGRRKNRNKS